MLAPVLITLFTDAGYCPRTGLASWAAWMKVDGRTLRRSGMLKDRPAQSHVAEINALANGIIFALRNLQPPAGSKIIAQSDCLSAVTALTRGTVRRAKIRALLSPAINAVHEAVVAADVMVEYRHVPGHAGKGTPRTAVNVACDKECRRLLREARAALKAAAKARRARPVGLQADAAA